MPAEDLDQQIRDLTIQVDQASKRRQRAEYERDAASTALIKAESKLAEFGVSTPEQAKVLLSTMEKELRQKIEEAKEALDRAV